MEDRIRGIIVNDAVADDEHEMERQRHNEEKHTNDNACTKFVGPHTDPSPVGRKNWWVDRLAHDSTARDEREW